MPKTDGDKGRGLYQKWEVKRLSDTDPPKHAECETFVIDWEHDKYAATAMVAYANACEAEYPLLAKSIRQRVNAHFEKRLEKERGEAVSTALVQPVGAPLSPGCKNPGLCGTKVSQTDDQGRMAVLPKGFVMRDGTFRCQPCRDVQVGQFNK